MTVNAHTAIAIFILFTSMAVQAEITVSGEIRIIDESGQEYLPGYIHGRMFIRYSAIEGNQKRECSRNSLVSNTTLKIETITMPPECETGELQADFLMTPNPGWRHEPKPTTISITEGAGYFVVKVVRPRQPTRQARQKAFRKGIEHLSNDLDTATFLMAEASRGGDLEFTVSSAEILEKSGHQDRVAILFQDKNILQMNLDPNTKLKLLTRQGNAARAAAIMAVEEGDRSAWEANLRTFYDTYSSAQALAPNNHGLLSIALAVSKEAAGATDYSGDLHLRLMEGPPVVALGLAEVYDSANFPGAKPTFFLGDTGSVNRVALKTASSYLSPIAGPVSY